MLRWAIGADRPAFRKVRLVIGPGRGRGSLQSQSPSPRSTIPRSSSCRTVAPLEPVVTSVIVTYAHAAAELTAATRRGVDSSVSGAGALTRDAAYGLALTPARPRGYSVERRPVTHAVRRR